jgi:asparagine synthase (glutamine-hydrolysing)
MSILFGICQLDCQPVEESRLLELAEATRRYAPDGISVRTLGHVGMGMQPYRTHLRSALGEQPSVDGHGNMLTLDGRIDNYLELCEALGLCGSQISDSAIVLAAFERWGEDCFRKLIGDWAVALWSYSDRSLFLARDHAGTRTLYFKNSGGQVVWSTFLETLQRSLGHFDLDEAYAARYLACQPTRDMTPFKGIKSAPPAHYLAFREDGMVRRAHWHWIDKEEIQYKTNAEYEERFLTLFRQSVDRRTGPGTPVLAQLSGGMDSTSIVCMSDAIRRSSQRSDLIDTLSYFDDSEPHWNERPYFSLVETARGKTGIHLEASYLTRTLRPAADGEGSYLSPGADSATIRDEIRLETAIAGRGYRAVLSGIGGDELLGGVPTPYPELCNLAVGCKPGLLFKRAVEWSAESRESLLNILLGVSKELYALYRPQSMWTTNYPAWLPPRLQAICRASLHAEVTAGNNWGRSPSSISLGLAWWSVLETLPHLHPTYLSRREFRYPYLDRDLVDFLLGVPRNQVIGPGHRRFLMRRALRKTVPQAILERRRKSYLLRGPLALLRRERESIKKLFDRSISVELGLLEPRALKEVTDRVTTDTSGQGWSALLQAVFFEIWLRSHAGSSVGLGSPREGRSLC